MASDEFVNGLRHSRETGEVIIAPRQPFPRRSISQRAIHRFSGYERFTIWLNEYDRAFELVDWNFGEPHGCLLITGIIDLAGSDFAPTFDPSFAKMTLAIPNHERLWRRVRNEAARFVSHQGPTSNVQRSTSNSESVLLSVRVGRSALDT